MLHFRNYQYAGNLFEGDFLLVRDFLLKLNNPTYSFGWWDHQMTRPSFRAEYLNRFGLWLRGERLVGIACVDENLGNGILSYTDSSLLDEMVSYAKEHLHDEGKMFLLIPDMDKAYQEAAARAGFYPTQERDTESVIQIDAEKLRYTLPEGYRIVSMADHYDAAKIERITRRGFTENRAERAPSLIELDAIDRWLCRPYIDLDLHVAVIAPDETFAAFCGMWRTAESTMAFVEPVVTDPDYQMKGLGRTVVYEALSRCGKLGATSAVVFSTKQFYFSIGFRPNTTSTWWKLKNG